MSKLTTQVNFRIPVSLKKKIEKVVAEKNDGSITEEIVNRLELTFDLSKAEGYNLGYRDATAHMTFALTAALKKQNVPMDEIQTIINETMMNFDKNG